MRTHEGIDQRSLAMARAIVTKIDGDPDRAGLLKARHVCERWMREHPSAAVAEWRRILEGSWAEIRVLLLEDSEEGRRLRQSSPFCGILSNRERWAIYRRYSDATQ